MSPAVYILFALLCAVIFFLAVFVWRARSAPPAMEMMQKQVEALRGELAQNLKNASDSLSGEVRSLAQSLQTQMQSAQGHLSQGLGDSAKLVQDVGQKIGALFQANREILDMVKDIGSLKDILKPPKLRGGMGETLLTNILQQIFPSEKFYEIQHTFKTGETVDAVIHLKDGLVPVDAKFPLENFQRVLAAQGEEERRSLKKEFARDVKRHIDAIAKKYILPDEGTFPFALMYIPAENVYYEIIVKEEGSGEADILSYAAQRHVFPVSPNSFYPYLMTLLLGLQGMRIEERAREILDDLSRLSGDVERFSKDFQTLGGHLTDAQKKFSEAEKRLTKVSEKLEGLKQGTPSALPDQRNVPQIKKEG